MDKPVRVSAKADKSDFELAVENSGNPIPAETLANLFEPFARGESGRNVEGLGLGLFIASEIAKAHGGTLGVTSDGSSTRFVLDIRASRRLGKIPATWNQTNERAVPSTCSELPFPMRGGLDAILHHMEPQ